MFFKKIFLIEEEQKKCRKEELEIKEYSEIFGKSLNFKFGVLFEGLNYAILKMAKLIQIRLTLRDDLERVRKEKVSRRKRLMRLNYERKNFSRIRKREGEFWSISIDLFWLKKRIRLGCDSIFCSAFWWNMIKYPKNSHEIIFFEEKRDKFSQNWGKKLFDDNFEEINWTRHFKILFSHKVWTIIFYKGKTKKGKFGS